MSDAIRAKLGEIGLVVSDVEAAARVLRDDLGLRRTDCAIGNEKRRAPVFAIGKAALALFAPDDRFVGGTAKPGVHHITLHADDLDAAVADARASKLDVEAEDRGLQGRRRARLRPGSTCGVLVHLGEPLEIERSPADPVERVDHIGVASADNRAVLDVFCNRLGFPLESTQTDLEVSIAVESFTSDKYGVVQHARRPEVQGGLRIAFVTVGDCDLEFLQDFDPEQGAVSRSSGPGTTRQDQSAIARYIASRGAGLHHLALKVRDIDATLATLARSGHAMIDRVGRPGSRRALIGFLHPRALHGVLVHLVQRDEI